MSENLRALENETERRFIILMTALQDFAAAYRRERQEYQNLLAIQEKTKDRKEK